MSKSTAFIIASVALVLASCTDNSSVRYFGGKEKMELPDKQKLVNVTWKESSLWVLTRPRRADEFPETYTFQEKSAFGVVQGVVVLQER
jgi:hypothetical protein